MTLYELIKVNISYINNLYQLGYKQGDEQFVPLYHDYLHLKREGYKTTYLAAMLAERYGISERKFYLIIKRFRCTDDAV